MPARLAARPPTQQQTRIHISRTRSRLRFPCIDRYGEEPYFAEAYLTCKAVGALRADPYILGNYTAETNRSIGLIGILARCLGKLGDALDLGPDVSINRGFNNSLFHTKAEKGFNVLIGIPNQQFMELIGPVKLILNPTAIGDGEPHTRIHG